MFSSGTQRSRPASSLSSSSTANKSDESIRCDLLDLERVLVDRVLERFVLAIGLILSRAYALAGCLSVTITWGSS